jgi:hypothetical protein
MEQTVFCGAIVLSDSQEIQRLLWNPNVHYRDQKGPLPVPILSKMNPLHSVPSGSIEGGEFLEYLSDYQLFKEESELWS